MVGFYRADDLVAFCSQSVDYLDETGGLICFVNLDYFSYVEAPVGTSMQLIIDDTHLQGEDEKGLQFIQIV